MKIKWCLKCFAIFVLVSLSHCCFPLIAFAGEDGPEGDGTTTYTATTYSSNYSIAAGGSVTMYLYKSADCLLLASESCDTIPSSTIFSGSTNGKYPIHNTSFMNGVMSLDKISISPNSGYSIEELIVNGSSKGAVTSFDFQGESEFNFIVNFKQDSTTPIQDSEPTTTTPISNSPAPKNTPTTETTNATPISTEVEMPVVKDVEDGKEPTSESTTTARKTSAFSLWYILLLIFLFIFLLLFILFLIWKKRRKKEKEVTSSKK
jgi:hypothetical protein